MDDLSRDLGQNDLRATTRQCFQIHGILKGNLRTVISSIMNIGSSTVGVRASCIRGGMAAWLLAYLPRVCDHDLISAYTLDSKLNP